MVLAPRMVVASAGFDKFGDVGCGDFAGGQLVLDVDIIARLVQLRAARQRGEQHALGLLEPSFGFFIYELSRILSSDAPAIINSKCNERQDCASWAIDQLEAWLLRGAITVVVGAANHQRRLCAQMRGRSTPLTCEALRSRPVLDATSPCT